MFQCDYCGKHVEYYVTVDNDDICTKCAGTSIENKNRRIARLEEKESSLNEQIHALEEHQGEILNDVSYYRDQAEEYVDQIGDLERDIETKDKEIRELQEQIAELTSNKFREISEELLALVEDA